MKVTNKLFIAVWIAVWNSPRFRVMTADGVILMIGGGVWFALDQSGSDLWQLLIVVGISLFFAPAYAAQRIIHKARQIENEEKDTEQTPARDSVKAADGLHGTREE
jgi:hypothetical protein